VVVNEVASHKDVNYGYDAARDEYKDLVKAGIIDPTKVARSALQNAVSIAGMFLTTEALIVDTPKEEKAPAMPPGGMGEMGGMGMY
jgi:chaperonin GroEL